jgi:hypothetical protein
MNLYSRKDDLLSGEDKTATKGTNGKTVVFSTVPGSNNNDIVKTELLRILAIHEKHDLSQHPEVLAGMLDDLKAKIKGGDILEILRDPLVYGGISVTLLIFIIWKISKKKKRM